MISLALILTLLVVLVATDDTPSTRGTDDHAR
jgi:hypothetical protein